MQDISLAKAVSAHSKMSQDAISTHGADVLFGGHDHM